MSPEFDFDTLLDRLRAGDQDAASVVFRQFAQRLVRLAASRLQQLILHKAGAEDIVQSVFRSFFVRQRAGDFTLQSWDGLWELLVLITQRKCCNRALYFQAGCRDVRLEVSRPDGADETWIDRQAFDRQPTPPEAVHLADTLEYLLNLFGDRERTIVELSLQGYTVNEVSTTVGCTERKVYRVLERVRKELTRLSLD